MLNTIILIMVLIGGQTPQLATAVCDFEAAVWQAFSDVMPAVEMRGCAFHWGQCLWRKLQALGLQTAYNNDAAFHHYCRQLFALPCLPHETIESALSEMENEVRILALYYYCSYNNALISYLESDECTKYKYVGLLVIACMCYV